MSEDKLLYEVTAHDGSCSSVAWSPDGKWLASGGKDRLIKLWGAADGSPGAVLAGHEEMVNSVAFHPQGRALLLSGSDDRTARLWDLGAGASVQALQHQGGVNSVGWSPDGRKLATGAGNLAQVFELAS